MTITISKELLIGVVTIVTILQTVFILLIKAEKIVPMSDFAEACVAIFGGVPAWLMFLYYNFLEEGIYLYNFNHKYCFCRLIKDGEEVEQVFVRKSDLIYFEQSKWSNNRLEVDDTLKRGSRGHVKYVKNVFPKKWNGHDLTPYLKDAYKDRK